MALIIRGPFSDDPFHVSTTIDGNGIHEATTYHDLRLALVQKTGVPENRLRLTCHGERVTDDKAPLGPLYNEPHRFQFEIDVTRTTLTYNNVPCGTDGAKFMRCSACLAQFYEEESAVGWTQHRCGHVNCQRCSDEAALLTVEEGYRTCRCCFTRTLRGVTFLQDGTRNWSDYCIADRSCASFPNMRTRITCKLGDDCNQVATIQVPSGILSCEMHYQEMLADAERGRRDRALRSMPVAKLRPCDILLIHEDHRSQNVEFYCETCDTVLCRGCYVDHVPHQIVKLSDVKEVSNLALQRWGLHAQTLINIEDATKTALTQLDSVERNRVATTKRLEQFRDERIASSDAQFNAAIEKLQKMIDESKKQKEQTSERIRTHVATLLSDFDTSVEATVASLKSYIETVSKLRDEVLDRHVMLSQITNSCSSLLLLKTELTDFVSAWRSTFLVDSYTAKVYEPRVKILPQMIFFRTADSGLWPDVKLSISPDDPNGISNHAHPLQSLPSLKLEYGAWRHMTLDESLVAMSHLVWNRFAENECEIRRHFLPLQPAPLTRRSCFEMILKADDAIPLQQVVQNRGVWMSKGKPVSLAQFTERCAEYGECHGSLNHSTDNSVDILFSLLPVSIRTEGA